ncbi:bioflim formation protein, partial [Oceanithermus sp.]
MKRLWILLWTLAGLALASTPVYPENSAGLGYAHPGAGVFTLGVQLPAAPLGLDTGLDLEVRYPRPGVSATGKILVLPSLSVGGQFMAVGAFGELRYADPAAFGGYLGGGFSWDLPPMGPVEGALSAKLGVGYFPKGSLAASLF